MKRFLLTVIVCCLLFSLKSNSQAPLPPLKISANHRFFTAGGKPFFWLGDTGWLLLTKLTREETIKYLDTRAEQGFNVIQVMVVHGGSDATVYGAPALDNKNVATPHVTPGNTFGKDKEYDYWDHMDWVIKQAAQRHLYVALVAVWGSVVKADHINVNQAKTYAGFLAKRFRSNSNLIWMNGGDIQGTDSLRVWNTIGNTLRANDPNHLITYHPRGRTQ